MIPSRTQHINHSTYLVAVNELYDTTVTCLTQFPDGTSYLSNRKQYLQIDDTSSSIVSINTGVPQGSILGPLLFNICINDIFMSSDKFNFILYADDTTLNATVESFGETAANIQLGNELQKLCKWLDFNKLHLNLAKSKFMLFHMP